MNYVAVIEVEYESDRDPLDELHHVLSRLEFVSHYHIVKPPRLLEGDVTT